MFINCESWILVWTICKTSCWTMFDFSITLIQNYIIGAFLTSIEVCMYITGCIAQDLRSLKWSALPNNIPLGEMLSNVSCQLLNRSWHTDIDCGRCDRSSETATPPRHLADPYSGIPRDLCLPHFLIWLWCNFVLFQPLYLWQIKFCPF
jgi:hypothetical protein